MDYSPGRGLAAAILLQAVTDYRKLQSGGLKADKDVNEKELKKFFSSAWFETLCLECNIDDKMVIKNLNKTTL